MLGKPGGFEWLIPAALIGGIGAYLATQWGDRGFPGAPQWFTGDAYGESGGRGSYQGRERYRYDPGRGLWRDDDERYYRR